MFDVTTFGEAMLRLSVPEGRRLQAATQFDVVPGGSEANCAMLLARLGQPVAWHSALPASAFGRMVADHVRTAGVDLDGVIWHDSGRVGTYYIEFAAPPRAIQVIYDRADSCITRVTPDQLHWDRCSTPASPPDRHYARALATPAATIDRDDPRPRARQRVCPISFDVNYRARTLVGSRRRATGSSAAFGASICCSAGKATPSGVFGIDGAPESMVDALAELSGAKAVAVTLGEAGRDRLGRFSLLSGAALPVHVIDRIGAGDALAMGIIHGWLRGDFAYGLRCGVTLAALALSQHGDAVITYARRTRRAAGDDAHCRHGAALIWCSTPIWDNLG